MTTPRDPRVNLLGAPTARIVDLLAGHVDRPFRARQVARWVHHRGALSFAEMTDLPIGLRHALCERFTLETPEVVTSLVSRDGSVRNVVRLADGATVETVTIPESNRVTVCVSSQTGCALGCRFCSTALLGSGRNLTSAEIVGQLRVALRKAQQLHSRVNVVFMGMGEPLLNRRGVRRAIDAISETISVRRVTVSTAGVVPGVRWLAGWERRPKLAVSLNAPDQARRAELMPIARQYPLEELMAAVRAFPLEKGRRITFEYVVIRGFNDAPEDARAVSRLLDGVPAKVNVIPLNPGPRPAAELLPPDESTLEAFVRALNRRSGLAITVRRSRGHDVAGACGQLTGAVRSTIDHCRPEDAPSLR